jgi:hypothetical protein
MDTLHFHPFFRKIAKKRQKTPFEEVFLGGEEVIFRGEQVNFLLFFDQKLTEEVFLGGEQVFLGGEEV